MSFSQKDAMDLKTDIAILMANQRTAEGFMSSIVTYMQAAQSHREAVITRLTMIEASTTSYQKQCDTERKEMSRDLDSLKLSHANQIGKNSMLAAVISMFMVVVGWIVEKKT